MKTTALMMAFMMFASAFSMGFRMSDPGDIKIDNIIANMTLDEEISQMLIPAFRTWNGANMTDLGAAPALKEALTRHQYGGVILFGTNIKGTEQVTKLLYDLQANNMSNKSASVHIPYLTAVDEEGGKVVRLNSGTRMTGNMAIGATKDATGNAEETGRIIGSELNALGFNTNFAPDIDVNNNPANPVIGTRSFSDDPSVVDKLGRAYSKGLSSSKVITTYKHYPGHGNTSTDSHIGTPSVSETYNELMQTELVPFKNAVKSGADMIMTAHITYPKIDNEVVFGDGKTKGYYPATMSKKMITNILRGDLGYSGVIVTDSLEMEAIRKAGLVPGNTGSVEYRVNIAKEVINAGVDMLLIPTDIKDAGAVDFYDKYISGIAAKVEAGEISKDRIDQSVKRILLLKVKYGIFDITGKKADAKSVNELIAGSKQVVGCSSHHEKEMKIAREAVTVVKNEGGTLPVSKQDKKVCILEDPQHDKLDTTADVVIGFSFASGTGDLDKNNPQYVALKNAIEKTHNAGHKFVLLSANLPYDAAIYNEADAIVLAYLGWGQALDPTREVGVASTHNANVSAALETIYGENSPKGHLPVNIPVVEENPDGTLKYGSGYLYKRGFRLTY